MSSTDEGSSDLSIAVRRLSASLIEGLQLRLDLLALELGEERRRLSQLVLSTLALSLALFMVFLCINLALLILFWEDHRIPIALGMCGFYGAFAAVLAFVIVRRIRRGARAFSATREVLEKDRLTLRELP
jgi:uncharacterized membrane protein YqjE